MRRWSLHPGWDVDKNDTKMATEEIVEEDVSEMEAEIEDAPEFHPDAAAVDENPFPEELSNDDSIDYESLTVTDLRELLKERSLPVYGTKAELIARLETNDASPSEEALAESVEAPSEEEVVSSEEDAQGGDVSESGEQQEDS